MKTNKKSSLVKTEQSIKKIETEIKHLKNIRQRIMGKEKQKKPHGLITTFITITQNQLIILKEIIKNKSGNL